MPPDVQKFYKPRIGNFTRLALFLYTIVCWGIMVICSATVIGEIVSELIGLGQDITLGLWLFLLGVYGGKSSSSKMLATFLPMIVVIVPFVNDLPAAVIEVVVLIFIVRDEDRKMAYAKAAAAKKALEEQQKEQAIKQQRAQIAAQNAAATAANDTENTRFAPANDNAAAA